MPPHFDGVPIEGKADNGGHLDIVFVCARVGELEAPTKQPPIEEMERELGQVVRLAAADHRALVKAAASAGGHLPGLDASPL